MFLQLGEVVERVDFVHFAGVDNAHEQIAYTGPVLSLVEVSVLAMQNRFFERSLADIIIQRGAGFSKEQSQFIPVPEHITNCLAKAAVGLDFVLFDLLGKPHFQFRHLCSTLGLVPVQSLIIGQALTGGLGIILIDILEDV